MKKVLTILVSICLLIGVCTSCGSSKKTPEEQESQRKAELIQPLADHINNQVFYSNHYDGTFRNLSITNVVRIHSVAYIPDENCIYISVGDNQLYQGISNGHITGESEISEWLRYDLGLFKNDSLEKLLDIIDNEKIGLVCHITSVGSPKNCAYTMSLNDYATPPDYDEDFSEDEFQPDDWEGNAE